MSLTRSQRRNYKRTIRKHRNNNDIKLDGGFDGRYIKFNDLSNKTIASLNIWHCDGCYSNVQSPHMKCIHCKIVRCLDCERKEQWNYVEIPGFQLGSYFLCKNCCNDHEISPMYVISNRRHSNYVETFPHNEHDIKICDGRITYYRGLDDLKQEAINKLELKIWNCNKCTLLIEGCPTRCFDCKIKVCFTCRKLETWRHIKPKTHWYLNFKSLCPTCVEKNNSTQHHSLFT